MFAATILNSTANVCEGICRHLQMGTLIYQNTTKIIASLSFQFALFKDIFRRGTLTSG